MNQTVLTVFTLLSLGSAAAQKAPPTAPLSLDLVVWRESDGTFYTAPGGDASKLIAQKWGQKGDVPVLADYDGDGTLDPAVWRPSESNWYVLPSTTGTLTAFKWGQTGDIPLAADYDGDGKADYAVWRPSDGNWYIQGSREGKMLVVNWGLKGDLPAVVRTR